MNRIKQLIEKGHAFEQSQDWEAAFTCYKEASELGTANWRYYQNCLQRFFFLWVKYHSQNPVKFRPILNRSLPDIRRLRRLFERRQENIRNRALSFHADSGYLT